MTRREGARFRRRGVDSPSVLRRWRWSAACVVVVRMRVTAARAQYVNRFATITNGAITFTGNTLGLSKAVNVNQAGTSDAIGAFTTINTALQVPTVPSPPRRRRCRPRSGRSDPHRFGRAGVLRDREGALAEALRPDVRLLRPEGDALPAAPLRQARRAKEWAGERLPRSGSYRRGPTVESAEPPEERLPGALREMDSGPRVPSRRRSPCPPRKERLRCRGAPRSEPRDWLRSASRGTRRSATPSR